jgi:hypothetical protein
MIWATWSRRTLLHVADHLVAPVLAEVDVEVRHRHAFGVQEALEQQREAQRVEVGDGQRPGHQRPGARAAARPDRNAMRLRPLDEVGNDQEVAGKVVFFLAVASPCSSRRRLEAFARLATQFGGLGRKFRFSSGLVLRRRRRSAAGSASRVCGTMDEQRRAISTVLSSASGRSANSSHHLGFRLQPVVRSVSGRRSSDGSAAFLRQYAISASCASKSSGLEERTPRLSRPAAVRACHRRVRPMPCSFDWARS